MRAVPSNSCTSKSRHLIRPSDCFNALWASKLVASQPATRPRSWDSIRSWIEVSWSHAERHLHSPVSSFKDLKLLKISSVHSHPCQHSLHRRLKISEIPLTCTFHFFRCLFSSIFSPIGSQLLCPWQPWPPCKLIRRQGVEMAHHHQATPWAGDGDIQAPRISQETHFPSGIGTHRRNQNQILCFRQNQSWKTPCNVEKSVEFHKKWNDIYEQVILDRSWV